MFLPIFKSDENINDFVIVIEQRDNTSFSGDNIVDTETATFEVAYLGTDIGSLWVVEPYARLIYTLTDHPNIVKLHEFNDVLYLFAYNASTDEGATYRNDSTEPTLLKSFTTGLSITKGVDEFGTSLFIGLENGELWEYTGFSFSLKTTFTEAISTVFGDKNYLYIGFQNSSNLVLYDGSTFTTLDIE